MDDEMVATELAGCDGAAIVGIPNAEEEAAAEVAG